MTKVAISYPAEIWSVGTETILAKLGCEVIGHWPDIDQALAALDGARSDLLIVAKSLLDLSSPQDSARPLAGRFFGKFVVVLEEGAELSVRDFVDWDVEGLILSSANGVELAECIADVVQGRNWVDPNVRHVLGNGGLLPTDQGGLSERELEVARLVVSGLSNKKVAKLLGVSDGTVKMHMHHILTKLHLPSRFDLARSFKDSRGPFATGPNHPRLRLVSGEVVPGTSPDN